MPPMLPPHRSMARRRCATQARARPESSGNATPALPRPARPAERACCQAGGHGIDREATPEQQPAEQRCGNGVEKAGEQARDANGEEVVGSIIAEQERKYAKQYRAAECQKRARRDAAQAARNHFTDESGSPPPRQRERAKERSANAPGDPFSDSEESGAGCACQRDGRADQDQAARHHPCWRQRANRAERRFDRVSDALQRLRLQIVRSSRSLVQDIVNLFIFHDSSPLCPFLNPVALIVSLNFL